MFNIVENDEFISEINGWKNDTSTSTLIVLTKRFQYPWPTMVVDNYISIFEHFRDKK